MSGSSDLCKAKQDVVDIEVKIENAIAQKQAVDNAKVKLEHDKVVCETRIKNWRKPALMKLDGTKALLAKLNSERHELVCRIPKRTVESAAMLVEIKKLKVEYKAADKLVQRLEEAEAVDVAMHVCVGGIADPSELDTSTEPSMAQKMFTLLDRSAADAIDQADWFQSIKHNADIAQFLGLESMAEQLKRSAGGN